MMPLPRIAVMIVVGFCSLPVRALDKAPKKHLAYSYEPSADHLGSAAWPAFLSGLSRAGYIAIRTVDLTPSDHPNVTLPKIAANTRFAGIFALLGAHGNASGPLLAQYQTEVARNAAFDRLVAQGFGEHLRKTVWSTTPPRYYIKVTPGFFEVNAWLNLSANRALIYVIGGESTYWARSLGGRVQFSYLRRISLRQAAADMRELLAHMTGIQPPSQPASAGWAYRLGRYSSALRMTSDSATVLSARAVKPCCPLLGTQHLAQR